MIAAIRVEQAHIDAGTRDDCRGCAVAVALSAVLVPSALVAVQSYRVTIDGYPCDPLGDSLRETVRAFDAGEPVEPTTVLLLVPERAVSRFRPGFLTAQGAA